MKDKIKAFLFSFVITSIILTFIICLSSLSLKADKPVFGTDETKKIVVFDKFILFEVPKAFSENGEITTLGRVISDLIEFFEFLKKVV